MRVHPVVVIPIYRLYLSEYEWRSLSSITSVLFRHSISILVPRAIVADLLDVLASRLNLGVLKLQCHVVDDHWLDSVASYNHLMLTPWFYNYYQDFSHLLIAQLDSYVFRDELAYWCALPYAYIGAPIYPEGSVYGEANCQAIGCGGFSLRNIEAFRCALRLDPQILAFAGLPGFLRGYNLKGRLFRLFRFCLCLLLGDRCLAQKSNHLYRLLGLNEDVIFGKYLPLILPWFAVPDYQTACLFALDNHVKEDLSRMDNVPFGAHAWYARPSTLEAWDPMIAASDGSGGWLD